MVDTSLLTVSHIAEWLAEPPQRVAYVIRKCRIKPVQRIGLIRLFSESQLEAIRRGLYDIQIRQTPIQKQPAAIGA